MLDVILYGYDNHDRIILEERRFADLRELSAFFSSPKAGRWRWAEVNIAADTGQHQVVHYSAQQLRAMIVMSSRRPSAN